MAARRGVVIPIEALLIRPAPHTMHPLAAFTWNGCLVQPGQATTVTYYVNRGRTAGGADTVYWTTPSAPDPTGTYYPYTSPPWTDITDVAVVSVYSR